MPGDITNRARKLMLADYAFRQSRDSLRAVLETQLVAPNPILEMVITGACVTYCRPFTNSDFYGTLGAKYTKFQDKPNFKQLHERIWNGRNWVYAHTDPEKAADLFGGTPSDLTNIEIMFQKPRGMVAYVNEPILSPDTIKDFIDLCQFQSVRVLEEFKEMIPRLFKSFPEYYKRYKIGIDIP